MKVVNEMVMAIGIIECVICVVGWLFWMAIYESEGMTPYRVMIRFWNSRNIFGKAYGLFVIVFLVPSAITSYILYGICIILNRVWEMGRKKSCNK
jgi:hypothetical protein